MKITLGAVVKGGTSLDYKTGSWRDQKPIVHYELCSGCGICEEVCPDNAIHKLNGIYTIDYDYCKGCGLCAYECGAGAIEMGFEAR
ncbi:MAG: 4Fe-4S binding protein [Deltaproteobacteria bacterium]|nr:4Fe-4S binding protein [Deltaproteobacteria bacterium]